MMKRILIFAFLLASTMQITAQIEKVDYALKYNAKTCLFDVYMVAKEGSASSVIDRAQFNAQLTIVTPVTSNVYVTESYMPLLDNQLRSGNKPANWQISNEVESPVMMPDSRFVSVLPELLPAAFYNNIQVGEEVKLFSFKVTPVTNCAKDVRLYDNNNDPNSKSPGMQGGDFRNGFTIGGVEQKYAGNQPVVYPNSPVIENVSFSMKYDLKLDVDAKSAEGSACQSSMYYEVYGPQGLIGDKATFLQMNKADIEKGEYKVVAIDNIGCRSETKFYPLGKEQKDSEVSVVETEAFTSEIFPVPTQNAINFVLKGQVGDKITGQIIDVQGKVVRSYILDMVLKTTEEQVSYETNLSPGMYSVELVINNKEKVNHKLLIIR